MSSLAAAYAEAGNFEDAVFWQQRSLADTNLDKERRENREKRLELFKNKKPYRME